MSKVILIDWSMLMFPTIFTYFKMPDDKKMLPTYTCLLKLIACLRRVGLNPDDTVIIALEGRSWRKKEDANYKANRVYDERLKVWFPKFNELIKQVDASTPFHFVRVHIAEADDVIAYGVRYFKDKECIIISADSDFEQLCAFDNVKIFSPKSKRYKIVKDPYKVLAKKIEEEKSDNLITPILTKADYEKRKRLVNLLTLPEEVEKQIEKEFKKLEEKEFDVSLFPYRLKDRFMDVYLDDKIVQVGDKLKKKHKRRKKKGGTK